MLFTQAYAGSPVSAPSRATFMTGQHSGHTLVRGNKEYWRGVPMVSYGANMDFSRVGQEAYDTAHVIIPEIMKDNGYATGMFGKWAGGYEGSPSTPDKRGIDEYYGYLCQFQAHLYYPNFLNRYSRSLGDTATVRVTLDRNILHPMYGPGYAERDQVFGRSDPRKRLSNGSTPARRVSRLSASSPTPCPTPSSVSPKIRSTATMPGALRPRANTATAAAKGAATIPPTTPTPGLRQ